jgi:hypothetical protein
LTGERRAKRRSDRHASCAPVRCIYFCLRFSDVFFAFVNPAHTAIAPSRDAQANSKAQLL